MAMCTLTRAISYYRISLQGFPPPERFITQGALGPYLLYPQLLDDLDLLKSLEVEASSDPHVLRGTPCCPGSVFGVVKVVTSIEQASVSGTF